MASGSDSARGTTVNVLILDEFAFLNKSIADKLFTSVYPVVSSSKNGKVIIVSTPNGKNNLYYDLWKKANNKNDPDNIDGWKAFRMDWW
jgi:phage FluMu gp28-like protein